MAVAVVDVQVKGSGAARELQKVNTQAKQLDASVKGVGRSAASATANIQRFGIAFRSVIGPIVAITGAVNLVSRSLSVLGERQADVAALENGLKKIGATSATLDRLTESADRLGKATLFNEEDFTKGFALLTSFQSIGVASYERVAQAAADVAQVTRQDVGSSLLQLAKALQDPVLGLTALARSGTQFSEQQKEQIKALVKNNELLQAQDFILREIEKQYGNAANAAGSAGYAGAVDSLQESFRDFQERLAAGVQPAVTAVLGSMAQLFDVVSKIPAPIGQAALAIGGATAGLVALNAAIRAFLASRLAGFIGTQIALMRAFGVQIYATAAAQGALTAATKAYQAAVVAAPWALAAVGIGLIISETYKAIAAQAEYNRILNEAPLDEVNKKIGELREQLAKATIESQNAAAGMSLMGGSAGFAQGRIAQLNTELADLVSRQQELALYQRSGVTPQAGFYGPGFAAPPAATKTGATAPTGKTKAARESQLANILAANELFRSQQSILAQIANAEQQRDTAQVLRLQRDQRNLEILNQQSAIQRDQTLPADEKQAKLKGIQDQLAASTAQYNREIAEFQRQAVESLPGYINDLSSAAAGYSSVLDYSQRLTDEQIKQQELAQGIANVVGQSMTSAFDALIQGTESFGNSLRKIASGVLIDIARQLLQIYVINQAINAISGLFGGGGGLLPGVKFNSSAFNMPQLAGALASGGPAMAGKSYLVGEKGPEIFTPNKSGTVIPNGAMGTSNIVVNVDAKGSTVEGNDKQANQLGKVIGAAVQQELIKQKKPGGLLA